MTFDLGFSYGDKYFGLIWKYIWSSFVTYIEVYKTEDIMKLYRKNLEEKIEIEVVQKDEDEIDENASWKITPEYHFDNKQEL